MTRSSPKRRAIVVPPVALAAVALLGMAAFAACESGKTGGATATPAQTAAFPGAAEMERARAAASEGRLATASDELAEALRLVEEAGPLRIRNLTLVEEGVRGYGLYHPKTDPVAPGRPILLYFEPAGMMHGREGSPAGEGGERWTIDVVADLAILDPGGTVLQKEENFLATSVESLRPNRELHFTLRLDTQGIQEGDYIAEVTLRDRIGKKTAVERIPIKVRIP